MGQNQEKDRLYPNVVLPMGKYFVAKMLSEISKSIAMKPELPYFLDKDIQIWEESMPPL